MDLLNQKQIRMILDKFTFFATTLINHWMCTRNGASMKGGMTYELLNNLKITMTRTAEFDDRARKHCNKHEKKKKEKGKWAKIRTAMCGSLKNKTQSWILLLTTCVITPSEDVRS